ncbi:MAG: CoA transferase [Hyphomicrobiaceae bacterium]|nr:CoA transferase [Hyphomicrobiaceae bacterium]
MTDAAGGDIVARPDTSQEGADHMTGSLPLQGIRVLDIGSYIAVPAAAVVLGDYGADIVKVEPPGEGDPHRANIHLTNFPDSAVNYPWHLDARNKRSVALDLKTASGRAALDRLIATADVLITNYPFPVRERLRLRYEDVQPANPRLVYASFSGYGESGPDANQIGFDVNAYFARSGLLDSARYAGQPPAVIVPAQGDRASAMSLVSAIMMALFHRERTGEGSWVATSLLQNGLWANGNYAQAALVGAFLPPRPPRDRPRSALANVYETRDGRWIQLNIAREDRMWPAFCEAMALPHIAQDARFTETPTRRANAPALTAILDDAFGTRDSAEWIARLKAGNVPFSLISQCADIPGDHQAAAAGAIVETTIDEMPRTVAAPLTLGFAQPITARPGPRLGEHTDEILGEAGLSASEIAALKASGAAA